MNFESMLGRDYATLDREGGLPDPRTVERIGDQSYVTMPRHGITIILHKDGTVRAVQFNGEAREGMTKFDGRLPAGLRFDMARDEARAHLGRPIRSGDESIVPILGEMPAWDRWQVDPLSVHAEYAFDRASIRLVTLGE